MRIRVVETATFPDQTEHHVEQIYSSNYAFLKAIRKSGLPHKIVKELTLYGEAHAKFALPPDWPGAVAYPDGKVNVHIKLHDVFEEDTKGETECLSQNSETGRPQSDSLRS